MTTYWERVEQLFAIRVRDLHERSGRPIAAVLVQVGFDDDDPRVFWLRGRARFGATVPQPTGAWDAEIDPIIDGTTAPDLDEMRFAWLRRSGLWIDDAHLDDEDQQIAAFVAIEREANKEISALALRAAEAGSLDLGAALPALIVHAGFNDDGDELQMSLASNPASRHAELRRVIP